MVDFVEKFPFVVMQSIVLQACHNWPKFIACAYAVALTIYILFSHFIE